MLNTPPPAGRGVHGWLFKVSRHLHHHLPATSIVSLLESRVAGCGRQVPRHEVVAAVQNSLACAWRPGQKGSGWAPQKPWPDPNQERIEAVLSGPTGVSLLWEASPVYTGDDRPWTDDVLSQLFPADALLCCGQSQSRFDTKPMGEWKGKVSQLQFVVPSPMSKLTGQTKAGKVSKHCLDNTGPRRFLVCEFDQGHIDQHAALLLHLGRYMPLVLAVHSGGKSMHGWFYVQGLPEEKERRFFGYAVSLGADRATWTRSQFVRMPDGTRDNGQRQTIYYFDPTKVTPQP
jgi:hypothetical protein